MKKNITFCIVNVATLAFFAAGSAKAEDHLSEAVAHTKDAITQGDAGHANSLVAHAEESLKHAKAAEAEKRNPHIEEGITHLQAAIEVGKLNFLEIALKQSREALMHLEAAAKE